MAEQIVAFKTKTVAVLSTGVEFNNIVDLAAHLASVSWATGSDTWLNAFNRYFEMYKEEFR